MKHRKLNTPVYLSLGLCTVLMVLCLMVATGTTFARYRMDQRIPAELEPRPLDQVYLGQWGKDGQTEKPVFLTEQQNAWKTVDGETYLEFTVSNGLTEESFAGKDLRVYVRVVGTLDIRNGGNGPVIKLLVPAEEEGEAPEEFIGKPERIPQGTQLYHTFGEGWIFRFCDKENQEIFQTLEGGSLNWTDLKLVMELPQNDPNAYTGLLQLQITGDYTIK